MPVRPDFTIGRVDRPSSRSGTKARTRRATATVRKPSRTRRSPGRVSGSAVRRAAPSGTRRSTPPPRRRPTPPPSPPPSRPSRSGRVERTEPPKPKPPGIKQFLSADEIYQQALRGGKRTLRDFISDLGRRRGEAKVQFGQTEEALEEDRVRQLERMRDEFASRGLIHSGLFAEEQGRFQEDFQRQMQQLEQQQSSLLADFLSQEQDFRRQQELAQETARAEALARRAARFNIPL